MVGENKEIQELSTFYLLSSRCLKCTFPFTYLKLSKIKVYPNKTLKENKTEGGKSM